MLRFIFLFRGWAMRGRYAGPTGSLSNSRFGAFNSRLGPNKFPFSPLRGFAGKGLIWLAVFVTKPALIANNRKNSQLHGKNRELARLQKHLGRVAEENLADGFIVGVARLDLLRQCVDVAEPALERAAGEDRIDPGRLVGPVG